MAKGDLILGSTNEEKLKNVEVVLRRILNKVHVNKHLVSVPHTFVEGFIDGSSEGRNFIGLDCKTTDIRLFVDDIQTEDKKKTSTLFIEISNGTTSQQTFFSLKLGLSSMPMLIDIVAGSKLRLFAANPVKMWYAILLEPKAMQSQIVSREDVTDERIQLPLG